MTTTEPAAAQAVAAVPEWTLGWRLQRALAHAEMRSEDMAEELGVVRSTVSRWMNDKGSAPRAIYLKEWALRTGVPYEWLTTGTVKGSGTESVTGDLPSRRSSGQIPSAQVVTLPLRNHDVDAVNGSSSGGRGQADARFTPMSDTWKANRAYAS